MTTTTTPITCSELEVIRKACIEKIITSEVALIRESVMTANCLGQVKYEKAYPWRYKNHTTYTNLEYESISEIGNRLKKIFVDATITSCDLNEKHEILVNIKWG